jgi:hypothetical protein
MAGDIPVETQDFTENENQDHADKDPRLFHVCSDTRIANNSNAVSGRQTRHANCNTAAQMEEAPIGC